MVDSEGAALGARIQEQLTNRATAVITLLSPWINVPADTDSHPKSQNNRVTSVDSALDKVFARQTYFLCKFPTFFKFQKDFSQNISTSYLVHALNLVLLKTWCENMPRIATQHWADSVDLRKLILRTIERYCLLTDAPHYKDNWETPFITRTIEIYPPRDAASNQHLADKEDDKEEGSNCALQRHAELDDNCKAWYHTWYYPLQSTTWHSIALYNDTQI